MPSHHGRGLSYIIGTIGHDRGASNEQLILAACQLKTRPTWMLSARQATALEDRNGIDIVIESDVGKLFIQVKSSKRGRIAFMAKQRRAEVAIVIPKLSDSPEQLLAKAVSAIAPIRKKYREERSLRDTK